eukprot:8208964-Alexandrium_andersonii.AAC.1
MCSFQACVCRTVVLAFLRFVPSIGASRHLPKPKWWLVPSMHLARSWSALRLLCCRDDALASAYVPAIASIGTCVAQSRPEPMRYC